MVTRLGGRWDASPSIVDARLEKRLELAAPAAELGRGEDLREHHKSELLVRVDVEVAVGDAAPE